MRFIVSFPLDPPCCLPLSSSPPSSSSIRERNENKVESKLELRHRRVGDKVSLMGIELEPLLEGHVHHERLVNLERVLRELPLDLRVDGVNLKKRRQQSVILSKIIFLVKCPLLHFLPRICPWVLGRRGVYWWTNNQQSHENLSREVASFLNFVQGPPMCQVIYVPMFGHPLLLWVC